MKKTVLFVALAAFAASPALAAPKKKQPAEPAMTKEQQQNDASWRLVKGAFPIVLPSWAQPVYHGMVNMEPPKPEAKPAKKKKTAKPS